MCFYYQRTNKEQMFNRADLHGSIAGQVTAVEHLHIDVIHHFVRNALSSVRLPRLQASSLTT